MSKELIRAAHEGDIAKVNELLLRNDIDINYVLPDTGGPRTALVTAIHEGRWEIAKLLIQNGARVGLDNCKFYEYSEVFKSAYIYIITRTIKNCFDAETFRMMLHKIDILNPGFSGWGNYTILKWFEEKYTPYTKKILQFMFLEAMLRKDENTLNEILQSKHGIHETITAKVFDEFLLNRTISSSYLYNATTVIETFVQQGIFYNNEANKMMEILLQKSRPSISLENLPMEIRHQLTSPSSKSFEELLCELQSLLNPELHLPKNPISALNLVFNNNFTVQFEIIRKYQNPHSLRDFLNLDASTIFLRLNACSNDMGENPAVLLLAEILLRFGDKKDPSSIGQKPLLTAQQQVKAIQVCNQLFSFKHTDKFLLAMCRQQQKTIATITEANTELSNKVDKLTEQTKSMEQKLDKLTGLFLLANGSSPTIERKKPGLFG